MNKLIKFIQKNRFIARIVEDAYGIISYNLPGGRALNPVSAVLLLTYRCNLRCKMCLYYNESEQKNTEGMIAKRREEELSMDDIMRFIDGAAGMKIRVLTLHGGEPLVYPGLFEISEYAREKGILVNFITNGMLLNEANIEKIIRARINSLTISIDGPEDIHDSVRGVKGAYRKAMDGIAIIKKKEKEGKVVPHTGISTYVSAMNQDYLMELFEELAKAGIANWGVGLVTYGSEKLSAATRKILSLDSGEGQGNLDLLAEDITGLDREKMLALRAALKAANKGRGMEIIFPSERAVKEYSNPFYNEANMCFHPWTRVVVSPYGEVFPCIILSMVSAVMGNIKKEPLAKIWNGEQYRKLRKQMKKKGLLPICSKCCVINNIKVL